MLCICLASYVSMCFAFVVVGGGVGWWGGGVDCVLQLLWWGGGVVGCSDIARLLMSELILCEEKND